MDEYKIMQEESIERLKSEIKFVKEDLDAMTYMFDDLSKKKDVRKFHSAKWLLQTCRKNFRKEHRICWSKLRQCEADFEKDEDAYIQRIKNVKKKHRDILDNLEDRHIYNLRELRQELTVKRKEYSKKEKDLKSKLTKTEDDLKEKTTKVNSLVKSFKYKRNMFKRDRNKK